APLELCRRALAIAVVQAQVGQEIGPARVIRIEPLGLLEADAAGFGKHFVDLESAAQRAPGSSGAGRQEYGRARFHDDVGKLLIELGHGQVGRSWRLEWPPAKDP